MGSPKIFNFWGEEKWRQTKLAREFLLASPFRRGIVATTTTMACLVLIRMRIMIFNASALIIFGTTFGVTFGTRKLFQKKYTHAETLVIQMFPRIV